MAEVAGGRREAGVRRLRWRMRGALLWPLFVVVTLLEIALLHWLPIAGDGSGFFGGLLLAGWLNLIAVTVVGGLGGIALRRVRGDLPKVVAENYAGLAGLGVVAFAFVVAGLVHRPELAAERADFAEQSRAVRLWVEANASDFARAHVDGADSVTVGTDLYRTCVPEPPPRDRLCLIVDTSHSPPRIKRDPSRESNASRLPRWGFR